MGNGNYQSEGMKRLRKDVVRALEDYKYINISINEINAEIDEIKESIQSVRELSAVCYSGEPGGSNHDHSDPTYKAAIKATDRINAHEDQIIIQNKRIRMLYSIKNRIERMMDCVTGLENRVIVMRYKSNLSWGEIEKQLSYSRSRLADYHKSAIEKITQAISRGELHEIRSEKAEMKNIGQNRT